MPCLGYVACIRDFGDRGAIFWLHLILGFRIWGIGLRVYIGRCVCIYIFVRACGFGLFQFSIRCWGFTGVGRWRVGPF